MNSFSSHTWPYSEMFAEVGYAPGNSKHCKNSISSLVPILGDSICPPAVAGFVMAIVVNTIQRVTIWATTHIRNKILKLKPSVADCNTSPSVIFKRAISHIKTSAFHADPNCVFFGFITPTRLAVGSPHVSNHLTHKAPTRFCVAMLYSRLKHHHLSTAVASANNLVVRVFAYNFRFRCRDNRKSSILTTNSDRLSFWHKLKFTTCICLSTLASTLTWTGCRTPARVVVIPSDRRMEPMPAGKPYTPKVQGWFVPNAEMISIMNALDKARIQQK